MLRVTADDEWVAEAYMETDYSKLGREDLEKVLLDHALFVLRGSVDPDADGDE